MRRHAGFLILALALALPAAWGKDPWKILQLGMSVEQAAATIGQPLVRCSGRGFQVWTYDGGAEMLFFGELIGWTAPGTSQPGDRSMDIWQAARPGTYFPTFLALLPKPAAPAAPTSPHASPADRREGALRLPVPVYRRW